MTAPTTKPGALPSWSRAYMHTIMLQAQSERDDARNSLRALIAERDRLHEAVARGMAGQREWGIKMDALTAQVASLREALNDMTCLHSCGRWGPIPEGWNEQTRSVIEQARAALSDTQPEGGKS